jgi:hypothetical protein
MAGSLSGIAPICFEGVSAVTATPSVQLGTRRNHEGNDYIYVYNAGNAQISQGMIAFNPGTSLSSGYSVTVSNAASQVGGIRAVGVVHNVTLTTGTYGWVCCRGVVYCALDASEVSMNSGAELTDGVDGGFSSYTGTSASAVRLGIALNSFITTVGTAKAMFKSPLYG